MRTYMGACRYGQCGRSIGHVAIKVMRLGRREHSRMTEVCDCAAPLSRLIMTLGVFDGHGPEGQEGAGDEN